MKHRLLYGIAAVLALILAVSAYFHLNSRDSLAGDAILLQTEHTQFEICLSELTLQPIHGSRINGKGETIPVDGQGMTMKELLEQYQISEYQKINVISDDSYSAELSAQEAENACILQEETGVRMVVFGDNDSKRSVSDVRKIIVE